MSTPHLERTRPGPHVCCPYCDWRCGFDEPLDQPAAEAIERFAQTVRDHLLAVHDEAPHRAEELVRHLLLDSPPTRGVES